MAEYIQVITTVPTEEDAERISEQLLEKRLAACIQKFKVKSSYLWKGRIEEGMEYILFIKTKRSLYSKLEKEILSIHPYEVPEIIALPIVKGYSAYLNWIDRELQ